MFGNASLLGPLHIVEARLVVAVTPALIQDDYVEYVRQYLHLSQHPNQSNPPGGQQT